MNLGARVLKTGIAVTLALYISQLLHFQSPVIAAVAAIFAIQPSIYRSWRHFREQLQANTLGAILALSAGMIVSNEPFAIGVVCIVVIVICLKMKMEDTIGLTLVTVIAVMEASSEWQFALDRFSQVLIGIACACLINIIVMPPRPKEQFNNQIQSVFNRLSLLLRTVISDEMKEQAFKAEKDELEKAVSTLTDKYKLFEEETKKLHKPKYRYTRQLVVYKQLVHTLRTGLDVLESIDEHYFQSPRTEAIDKLFDEHVEALMKGHEFVLLKLQDKVKPESTEIEDMQLKMDVFLNDMIKHSSDEEAGMQRLALVASSMYRYGFQISRLDRLVGHVEPTQASKPIPSWWKTWFKSKDS
ncbi:aromatic acid exporter family protein [Paenibacillus arenosi]|uniref:FUSC family protein n=1 Tax=Paenibacillus arenosi TaxID=2774142 RepID=A0ABR9ATD2_9BACL|nr:FUSC family protein [Paenibacillus arenosi]